MREDLLRGRGATVDSVGTEVVFLAVSHPGSRSRRGAPMCRGASTRSPPVFHQAAGPIVLSPADARVGQNGITDLQHTKRTVRHFAKGRGGAIFWLAPCRYCDHTAARRREITHAQKRDKIERRGTRMRKKGLTRREFIVTASAGLAAAGAAPPRAPTMSGNPNALALNGGTCALKALPLLASDL